MSTSTGMVWQLYLHKVNPSAKIIKPRQNDCNILGATCCARLATLLRYVATCCHMLGAVGSNLKLVKFFVQHRKPSHPFGIWIKDQISRYFEFLIHARGLLVRGLEPRFRKTLVARSDPPRNLRVPDFRDLGSRPPTSRPRNLPRARIKTHKGRHKTRAIKVIWSFIHILKRMRGLPVMQHLCCTTL